MLRHCPAAALVELKIRLLTGSMGSPSFIYECESWETHLEGAVIVFYWCFLTSLPSVDRRLQVMGKLRFVQMAGIGSKRAAEGTGLKVTAGNRLAELEAVIKPELISVENGAQPQLDEMGNIKEDLATCGMCGLTWNDALITNRTPAPSARCPYENIHPEIAEWKRLKGQYRQSSITNHFASELDTETKRKIASMGLFRVAGNVYECPSTADFWKVSDGKIMRLSGDEVDNGESIAAAPADKPMEFLSSILDDLSF
jgi:hypothetical protein